MVEFDAFSKCNKPYLFEVQIDMTTKWQCHLVMDYLVEKGLGSTLFNEHITKRS